MDPLPVPPVPAVLLVTTDDALAAVVVDVVAAAGGRVRRVARTDAAGPAWHRSPLVLVGDDVLSGGGLPADRRDVVVVTASAHERVLRRAARSGVARVVLLPDARGQLLDLVAGLRATGPRAPVVGVLGGRGGAGASTFALALGLEAAWTGTSAVLVDGDPLGGGLDVLAGVEHEPGLRWPDLAAARGAVRGDVLSAGLPVVDGLGVLSWDRAALPVAAPEPDAVRSVLAAAAGHHDLVLVDLPRSAGAAEASVWRQLDEVVLVVPAELRAALAALRLLDQVGPCVPRVRLVVRTGRAGSPVPADLVGEVLELPVLARWPSDPRLPAAADRSDLVAVLRRGRRRRAAATVLDAVTTTPRAARRAS